MSSDELRIMRAVPRSLTREEAAELIRKVMGPPKRDLEGKEYDDVWLLLQLATPYKESNNQRSLTYEYKVGGKIYYVTHGFGDTPIIQELLEEDDI